MFGQRMRDLREAASLSQTRLAQKLGVTRNSVSQWEAGVTQPSTKRLPLLAAALGVPIAKLIPLDDDARQAARNATPHAPASHGFEEAQHAWPPNTADSEPSRQSYPDASRLDLLLEILRATTYRHRTGPALDQLQPAPPADAILAFVRRCFEQDLGRARITLELLDLAWQRTGLAEADVSRLQYEFTQSVVDVLTSPARETPQLNAERCQTAAEMILAIYLSTLRRALLSHHDVDQASAHIAPHVQLTCASLHAAELSKTRPAVASEKNTA